MNKEAKEQRIATLLADLQDRLQDLAFIQERIDHTHGPAKDYYTNQKRLDTIKLEKVRSELERLRAVQ
jgi:hypothetical protein